MPITVICGRETMSSFRQQVLDRQFLIGAWCNLGSSITTEMASTMGYDWVLVDQEHGPGDNMTLLHQMQSISIGQSASFVRITWNEMPRFKRALDLGAAGIMIPYVQNKKEAELAAASMRYSPAGLRGVASSPRATGYGANFDQYYATANSDLTTVVQIETAESVSNIRDIAEVDGVDVLFVGPLDLSISLNMPGKFNDPEYLEILSKVSQTAQNAGKAAGILLPDSSLADLVQELGYTFVAAGTDGSMVMSGFKNSLATMRKHK